jgi:hypothetical protein
MSVSEPMKNWLGAVLSCTAMAAMVANAARRRIRVYRQPIRDPRPGVRGSIQKVATRGVADVPGVEVAGPPVHGEAGDRFGIADESGEDAGFADLSFPELFREGLVFADAAGDGSDWGDIEAERVGGVDAEAGHAFEVLGELDLVTWPRISWRISSIISFRSDRQGKVGSTFWPFFNI